MKIIVSIISQKQKLVFKLFFSRNLVNNNNTIDIKILKILIGKSIKWS